MRTVCVLAIAGTVLAAAQQPAAPPFRVEETTIAQIHDAIKAGRLTCRALVDAYLKRIDAYDKNGPAINAIVQINPDAQRQADDLDRRYAQGGLTGALHCVPAIVKDNFETIGLQSAAGSLSLKDFVSSKDAFQVKRIKDAGAIVLAKSNMAEFAFSPYETVNSILPGYTRNPYSLDRVTAGSSGGTAAAVAANFGAIGLGSDTGNSIRGPASHQALAGIRSTMGLTSRAGVVPLSLLADIAGPMTRTLEDAVAVFQVVAGEDPDDPATAASRGRAIPDYRQSLKRDALEGARIGILRQAYERETTDPEVVDVFMAAVGDLRAPGRRSSIPRVSISPPCSARRARAAAAASSTTSTATSARRAIACTCIRSRRSSGRGGSIPRSKRGSAPRRTGARTARRRRRARRNRSIARRSVRRSPGRWTRRSSTRSSIRRGAIRRD